jgi:hypothetical protein
LPARVERRQRAPAQPGLQVRRWWWSLRNLPAHLPGRAACPWRARHSGPRQSGRWRAARRDLERLICFSCSFAVVYSDSALAVGGPHFPREWFSSKGANRVKRRNPQRLPWKSGPSPSACPALGQTLDGLKTARDVAFGLLFQVIASVVACDLRLGTEFGPSGADPDRGREATDANRIGGSIGPHARIASHDETSTRKLAQCGCGCLR